jgi:hypothetical protein
MHALAREMREKRRRERYRCERDEKGSEKTNAREKGREIRDGSARESKST